MSENTMSIKLVSQHETPSLYSKIVENNSHEMRNRNSKYFASVSDDGSLAGFIGLVRFDSEQSKIIHAKVLPEFYNQGVMELMLNIVKTQCLTHILTTTVMNDEAGSVRESCGFIKAIDFTGPTSNALQLYVTEIQKEILDNQERFIQVEVEPEVLEARARARACSDYDDDDYYVAPPVGVSVRPRDHNGVLDTEDY